jgi:dolichol-phosphate mannosyltransferase
MDNMDLSLEAMRTAAMPRMAPGIVRVVGENENRAISLRLIDGLGPDLSVVIPVRDEACNVSPLFEELQQCLAGMRYEIIFVDDASADGTADMLMRLREKVPTLRVLRHASGAGQSAALLTGVRAARGEWIATLDGDGQNDPADLIKLWHAAMESEMPAGLYIGHRMSRHDNRLRLVSSRVANGVRSRLLRDRVPDSGCGVKLFRRTVFLSIPYFDHMHRFLPALMHREGLEVRSVPVGHRPRKSGYSKYGVMNRLWVGIADLAGVMWLLHRRRGTGRITELGVDD